MSMYLSRSAELFQSFDRETAKMLKAEAVELQSRGGEDEIPSTAQTRLQRLFLRHFVDVESLNPDQVLPYFAPEAAFDDPHYPNPRMRGIDQITEGIRGGLRQMESMSFTPLAYTEGLDGRSAFVLMETAHQLRGGPKLEFTSGFFVKVNDEYKITYLKALLEHPPGPPIGIVLAFNRLKYNLNHRR